MTFYVSIGAMCHVGEIYIEIYGAQKGECPVEGSRNGVSALSSFNTQCRVRNTNLRFCVIKFDKTSYVKSMSLTDVK